MTTTKIASEYAPQEIQLLIEDPKEAKEVFHANGRYGISWLKGAEAAERSIAIANRIKSWQLRMQRGEPAPALLFMNTEVDFVIENLEKAQANRADSHCHAAKAVLANIVFVEAEAQPILPPRQLELAS